VPFVGHPEYRRRIHHEIRVAVAVAAPAEQTHSVTDPDAVADVLRAYGITDAVVTPLDIHGSTSVSLIVPADGVELMLKRAAAAPETRVRLVEQVELTRELFEHGVPVAAPIVALTGEPVVCIDDVVFTLSMRLTARTPGVPNRSEVWAGVGAQLATLHAALEECAASARGWTMDLPRQLADEIWPAFDESTDASGTLLLDPADRRELSDRVAGLPVQRLHGDMHGGNILLDGQGVYGIVDFDEIPISPRVNDIGYYAADLVKNRADLPGDVVDTIGAVVAGYHEAAALSGRELDALVPLMIISELRLLWWFRGASGDSPQRDIHLDTLGWILAHRGVLERAVTAVARRSQEHG